MNLLTYNNIKGKYFIRIRAQEKSYFMISGVDINLVNNILQVVSPLSEKNVGANDAS